MANITITMVPPVAADLGNGRLRMDVNQGVVTLTYYADPSALPKVWQKPLAQLAAGTRADGVALLTDLLTTEGAAAAMGF